MNIAELILKFFLGPGAAGNTINPVEISKQIITQLKKALKSLIVLFICSVNFCLLTGYLVDRILTQMDAGSFLMTNSVVFLLIFLGLNFIIIAWILNRASVKEEIPDKEILPAQRADSPIETAIAALILHYIKEREAVEKPIVHSDSSTAL